MRDLGTTVGCILVQLMTPGGRASNMIINLFITTTDCSAEHTYRRLFWQLLEPLVRKFAQEAGSAIAHWELGSDATLEESCCLPIVDCRPH